MTPTRDPSLEEMAAAVAGTDLWNTPGIPGTGLAGLRVTDGPNGARGPSFTGVPSACFPCGTALGATWDPDLVQAVGAAIGEEARTKGAHVLLAPTVNLHRHPLAGRNFECYSEDPYLTAQLAVGFVRGVQSVGVGTTVKHFVANDSEFERMTISSDVDEAVLRELYLVPFEAAVRDGGAWGIMSAYNRLNGTYCSEHEWLLTKVLRDEWGFDGFVISDWFGTHSTAPAANAGLDLEMPGPPQWFGAALVTAVERGEVQDATVAAMVERLALLATRTGAADGVGGGEPGSVDDPRHRALIRETAAASFVLLRNDGVLPLDRSSLTHVALIGTAADTAWIMGGGSAALDPHPPVTPRAGLRAALAPETVLEFSRGPAATDSIPILDASALTGRIDLEVYASPDLTGAPVITTTLRTARALWLGEWTDKLDPTRFSARLRGTVHVDESGEWTFGLSTTAACRVSLDGEPLIDAWDHRERGTSFFGFGSAEIRSTRALEAGQDYSLEIEFSGGSKAMVSGLELGAGPPTPSDAIERAVAVARDADVAIVVVGTGPTLDTEGHDRPSMQLPGAQDDLVRAIVAANPRTVVCVNAGSPVSMDWAETVPALLQCWLPGAEWGNALADVLLGECDPGGRLPTTFPARVEDSPAHATYPGADGHVQYADGLLMGYRGYDRTGTEPRFCFGHGLSYTTFQYGDAHAEGRDVSIEVTNTGTRSGTEVVQLYVHRPDAPTSRPEQELRRFTKVTIAPGDTTRVEFELDDRCFSEWHDGWQLMQGRYELRIGASSRDIRTRATLRLRQPRQRWRPARTVRRR